jgi:tetratricopeptide (TPR) repeat protein
MAIVLAEAGSAQGVAILFDSIDSLSASSDVEGQEGEESAESGPNLIRILTSIKDYYITVGKADEGYGRLLRPIESALEKLEGREEDAARLCNAIEMLAFAARRFADGVEWGERTIKLNPSVASYRTNLAMCYERLNRIGEAKNMVDSALSIDPNDSHALAEAVDIYDKLKDAGYVNELMNRLQQIDQEKYLVKRIFLSGE